MKKIIRSSVIAAASVASMLSIPHGKESTRHKKQRAQAHAGRAPKGTDSGGGAEGKVPLRRPLERPIQLELALTPVTLANFLPAPECRDEPVPTVDRYPWKREIVTTTFWIGEKPGKNNPVPNRTSSWDKRWAAHYGGTDTPDRADRVNFHPADFIPGENPFYVALPYNDVQMDGHKPEAEKVVPWFKEAYCGPGKSVCKGRWVAIRFKDRTVYAQWEDCGPFRTDHAAYVFGDERPKKNLNKGAGLDVSPAVRDYLGMDDTDVTDWKFVDFDEVPHGPWANYGRNNTFVINRRLANAMRLAVIEASKTESE